METIFIIAVILFAIYWQFYFLKDSIKMINQLKNIFSEKQSYHSKDYYIPANEFGNTSYEEILYKEAFYTDPSYSNDFDWSDRGKKDKISLVDISSNNPIGLRIEVSINNYLIRNKGLASDFSTIKDTVERNCTMLESIDHRLKVAQCVIKSINLARLSRHESLFVFNQATHLV